MSDAQLFIEATQFAIKAHDGQVRLGKAKLPYVCHPLQVANVLAANGFGQADVILAAAVLHDVLEDCDVGGGDLLALFGSEVSQLVQEVSWTNGESKADKLRDAYTLSPNACYIKTVDLACNINSIVEDPTAFSQAKAYGYVRYACAMYKAFQSHIPALNKVFERAVLNFNLNYQPQEI